jgi:hypothetical protein
MAKMNYQMTDSTVLVRVVDIAVDGEGNESEEVLREKLFAVADVPAELADGEKVKSLAAYGLTKLLQDRTSQLTDPLEKFGAMEEAFANFFTQGLWKAPSQGGSRKAAVDPFFAQAVADLKGWSITQAVATIQALDKDQRATLREAEKVQEAMKALRSEAGEVDVDELMAGLS